MCGVLVYHVCASMCGVHEVVLVYYVCAYLGVGVPELVGEHVVVESRGSRHAVVLLVRAGDDLEG
jgi:hypothetical protein